jgi:DNA gyrase/topoisomerase IV subunit A
LVIELKRDASSDVVLNQLYRFSNLQQSFGVNMLALNDGRPVQMNLKELLVAFVAFREEVVTKPHQVSIFPRPATVAISWLVWPSPSPISMKSSS